MKFLCFGLLFFADFQLFACSEVTCVNIIKSIVVSARTLDLSEPHPTNIVLNPRGLSNASPTDPDHPSFPPLQWVSLYGSVVVSGAADQNLAVVDGINEKGLSVATLWFEHATYPTPPVPGKPVLAVSYLARYILDNFATVADAVTAINSINIFGDYFDPILDSLPVHVTIHDATGDSALIEFTSSSPPTPIWPIAPWNVTTNEPSYSEQVANLDNYCYFTPPVFPATDCSPGLLLLPGDIDSESRFVRLAAFLKTTPSVSSSTQALAYVYSIINTVVEPVGSLIPPYSLNESFPTWWIAIRDNINLKYFLQPAQSETFFVDLTKIDFSSPNIKHRTLNLYQPGLVDDVTMLLLLGNEF